jgi:hypothetical protein
MRNCGNREKPICGHVNKTKLEEARNMEEGLVDIKFHLANVIN